MFFPLIPLITPGVENCGSLYFTGKENYKVSEISRLKKKKPRKREIK